MSTAPLFLAPLRTEALALRRGARRAEIVRIGMGPVRATSARTRLARVPASRPIVLFGFAGALGSDLSAGELVVATSCSGIDEDEALALPAAASVAELLEAAGVTARLGPVVSAPRILKGVEDRRLAGARGALAVDMESRWCAPLARDHHFAVVRAVVDVPAHDLLSVATPAATWRAFRALVAAARALEQWAPPLAGAGPAAAHPYPLQDNSKVGDY